MAYCLGEGRSINTRLFWKGLSSRKRALVLMFASWIFLLLIPIISIYASETTTASTTNVTTLYPINKTIIRNKIESRHNDTEIGPSDDDIKPCNTEIQLKDTEITPNDTEINSSKSKIRVNDTKEKFTEIEIVANETDTRSELQNKTRLVPQTWKIESGFSESNLTKSNNTANIDEVKEEKENNDKELFKDFKPSQHLGSFFDDDSAEVIKTPIFEPVEKKPPNGFVSSPNEEQYNSYETFNKIPKEIYYTHQEFPYKFEDTIFTRTKEGWPDSMDTRPTVEVPVKVPAGGLYKSPEVFKEKPNSNEEMGLVYYEDGRGEHSVKKRVNPWQNLLRLVTAFIPVGLIISALTPSVITIHNVDNNQQPSSLPYRRSDPGASELAPISERCRRRLLCEIHSDRNYLPPSSIPRRSMKHCYKIHCEDTEALWRMLRWLFTYNQGSGDQRARHLT